MLNLQEQYKQDLSDRLDKIRDQITTLQMYITTHEDVEYAVMLLRHIISHLSSVGDDLDFYRYVTYKSNQNGNDRAKNNI